MPAPIIQVAHPGQYLQEVEIGPRLISGVGRSFGAMPVIAEKGPMGLAVVVRSLDEYRAIFGGPVSGYYSFDAVAGYFSEARAPLIIVRTSHWATSSGVSAYSALHASKTFADALSNVVGTAKGANQGEWANGIQVTFLKTNKNGMTAKPLTASDKRNLTVAEGADSFEAGDFVFVADTANPTGDYGIVKAVDSGSGIVTLNADLSFTPGAGATLIVLTNRVTVVYNGQTEVHEDLSISDLSPNYMFAYFSDANYGINSKSSLITMSAGTIDLTADSRPANATIVLDSGSDGLTSLSDLDFVGTSGVGAELFSDVEDAKILFCVDHWGLDTPNNDDVFKGLVKIAKNKRFAFALGDLSESATKTGNTSGSAYYETQTGINCKDMFGAIFYPWLQIRSQLTGRDIFMPAVGDVSGVITQVDDNRGINKAPAGEAVVLNRVSALKHVVTDADQDALNPIGVNCIRTFPGVGTVVWGARTQSNNPKWRYINVRRFQSWIEESVIKGTRWAVFEPNTDDLRNDLKAAIESFLTRLCNSGTLASRNPEEAFVVRCDRTNNTVDSVDEGKLVIDVGVAHQKPGEFLIYRFTQTRLGAQIEQIAQL